jgi:hypothetical protein
MAAAGGGGQEEGQELIHARRVLRSQARSNDAPARNEAQASVCSDCIQNLDTSDHDSVTVLELRASAVELQDESCCVAGELGKPLPGSFVLTPAVFRSGSYRARTGDPHRVKVMLYGERGDHGMPAAARSWGLGSGERPAMPASPPAIQRASAS